MATPKRKIAPKAARARNPSIADLREQLDRLTRERDEALARQTATADILRIISQSPTDVRPVFERIVETAVQLLQCDIAVFFICDHATYSPVVGATLQGPLAELGPTNLPINSSANFPSRAIIEQKLLYLPDWSRIDLPEHERDIHAMLGLNSALYLPLLRADQCIGLLALADKRVDTFTAGEIALAESFRDQAVIAIENVRLFEAEQHRTRELSESLEQQTATSEVLRVISSSQDELQPVFDSILANATRVCHAQFGHLLLCEGDAFRHVATRDAPIALTEKIRGQLFHPHPESPLAQAAITKQPVQVDDLMLSRPYLDGHPAVVAQVKLGGTRTLMCVPMLSASGVLGVIVLYRNDVHPFSDKQIELVQNFAAQAVIAIENARLLNELRQRTDDLSEALDQQTATSEVLQTISSSPGDLDPVFVTMLEKAVRICDGQFGNIYRWDGEALHAVASHNTPSPLTSRCCSYERANAFLFVPVRRTRSRK